MGRSVFTALLMVLFMSAEAQETQLHIGFRSQKSIKFYLENGVSGYITADWLMNNRLRLGLNYVTSRLGTAFASNAVKQDNIFASGHWIFGKKDAFHTWGGLNLGFFHADYEQEVFDVLPNNAIIISPEVGIQYKITPKLLALGGFGYQLTSGSGDNGPGTLYPFYFQFSALWNFKK